MVIFKWYYIDNKIV